MFGEDSKGNKGSKFVCELEKVDEQKKKRFLRGIKNEGILEKRERDLSGRCKVKKNFVNIMQN